MKLPISVDTDDVIDRFTSPPTIKVITLAATVGGVTDETNSPTARMLSKSNILTKATAYKGHTTWCCVKIKRIFFFLVATVVVKSCIEVFVPINTKTHPIPKDREYIIASLTHIFNSIELCFSQ